MSPFLDDQSAINPNSGNDSVHAHTFFFFIVFLCTGKPDCSLQIGSTYEQFLAANASLGMADDANHVQSACDSALRTNKKSGAIQNKDRGSRCINDE